MTENILEYRVGGRWLFAGLVAFFSVALILSLNWAADPAHVVKFKGIALGKAEGRIFLQGLAIFSALMVLLGAAGFVATFVSRRVSVGATQLRIPKNPLSFSVITLGYGDIIDHRIENIGKIRRLVIKHRGGVIHVPDTCFRDRESFEFLCRAVAGRGIIPLPAGGSLPGAPQPSGDDVAGDAFQVTISRYFTHVVPNTREGRIASIGSSINILVGTAALLWPAQIPLNKFISVLCLFWFVPLFLFHFKWGYQDRFRPSIFTGLMLVAVAAIPLGIHLYNLLRAL